MQRTWNSKSNWILKLLNCEAIHLRSFYPCDFKFAFGHNDWLFHRMDNGNSARNVLGTRAKSNFPFSIVSSNICSVNSVCIPFYLRTLKRLNQ